jgi:benzoylformate decarboxylase
VPRQAEIEAALPDAIVVDESITASIDLARTVQFERPGDYVGARGGGIGQALPGALGVKLATERPVVAVGDGSRCTASRRTGPRRITTWRSSS